MPRKMRGPLTAKRLAEIEKCLGACTEGAWMPDLHRATRRQVLCFSGGKRRVVATITRHTAEEAKSDVLFLSRSKRYVEELLAEVQRLRVSVGSGSAP